MGSFLTEAIDVPGLRLLPGGKEWALEITRVEASRLSFIPGLRVGGSVATGPIDAIDIALYRLGRGGINDAVIPVYAEPLPGGLRPYQARGVSRLVAGLDLYGGSVLADDMGLGKSRQAIVMGDILGGRVLVVAPASVRETWREQLRAVGQEDIAILGPPSDRRYKAEWARAGVARWLVVSYELCLRAFESMGGLPTTLIIDEAHIVKGRTNAQTKAVKRIANVSKYRLAITGTPQWDRLRDWFSLLDITLPDVFGNSWHFDHAYCGAKRNEWGGLDNKGATRTDELQRRLRYYMVRRTKREVAADLPAISRQIVWLDADAKAKAAYDKSVMFQGVGQLSKALAATYEGKLRAAVDLAVAARKFLLFTYRREDAVALCEMIKKEGVPAQCIHGGIVSSQRSTVIRTCLETGTGLVATLDVLNAGVDGLQKLTSNGIFHAIDWQPNKMAQAEARLHRIGQTEPVSWTYLAMRDTADEPVVRTVIDKLNQQLAVMGGDEGLRNTFDSYDNGAGQDEEALLASLYAGFSADALPEDEDYGTDDEAEEAS